MIFRSLLLGLICVSGLAQSARSQDQDTELVSMRPVSGGLFNMRHEEASIGGKIYDSWIRSGESDPEWATFDLGRKYKTFRCYVGIRDEDPDGSNEEVSYSFTLDGKTVKSGQVEKGDAQLVEFSVAGVRAFRVDIGRRTCIADAKLFKTALTHPGTSTGTSKPSVSPTILSPATGDVEKQDNILFQWKPVKDATCYALQIVQLSRDGSQAQTSPRMWAITTTNGAISVEWDASGIPDGKYNWTVLAFNDSGVLGVFSRDSTFRIKRRS